MKLTVKTKSLVEAITWTTKALSTKDTKSYVALIVKSDTDVRMFHTNDSSFLKSDVEVESLELSDAETKKGGVRLALDGRTLPRIANALVRAGETTVLEYDASASDSSVKVTTKGSKFTAPVLNVRFVKEPEIIALGTVDNAEYFSALQRISKLSDPGSAGQFASLSSVDIHLDLENYSVVLMATDRYTLSEIVIPFDATSEAAEYVESHEHLLMPIENARLIPPIKGLAPSTTFVHEESGDKFGYDFGDGRVALFALGDTNPIKYESVKRKALENTDNSFRVDTHEFAAAIGTVSSLAWDEAKIFLNITKDDGLVITDENQTNKVAVEIEDLVVDDDYRIVFIRTVLTKTFFPIATPMMNLKWKTENGIFLIEPVLDDRTVLPGVFVSAAASSKS